MPRTLLCFAALAVFVLPCRADEPSSTPETLIRLNVSPAPAPKPALRYLLLPELREMNPGNPIQNYMKCFMEQQKFFFDKEAFERREKLLTMPLKELPAQELKDYGWFAAEPGRLGRPARHSRLAGPAEAEDRRRQPAAPRRAADAAAGQGSQGAVPGRGRPGPLRRRPPNRQDDVRHVAPPGRAPDDDWRPGGYLDRERGHRPPGGDAGAAGLPQPLLGADEPAQSPGPHRQGHGRRAGGCPGGVPRPGRQRPDERGPDQEIHRAHGQAARRAGEAHQSCGRGWTRGPRTRRWSVAARRRLVEHGLPEERLLRFPADQVILLDEKREYEVRRDDVMKIMNLPVWQVQVTGRRDREGEQGAGTVRRCPGGGRVQRSQGAGAAGPADRAAAARRGPAPLRRGAHGTLPAKLSDVSVPLPDDPFTGKPFRYEVTGNTAHLRGTPPLGEEKNPDFNIHYEVTLQK